jgi:hypothetical protein
MTDVSPGVAERIRSLIDTCALEALYLRRCDSRLFALPLTVEVLRTLPQNDDVAERVDAFVAPADRNRRTPQRPGGST